MSNVLFNPTPEEMFARHKGRIERCRIAIEDEIKKSSPNEERVASLESEIATRKAAIPKLVEG
jgi:hypothetical protein